MMTATPRLMQKLIKIMMPYVYSRPYVYSLPYVYSGLQSIKKTVSVHEYIQYYTTTSFISFQNSRKATIMATSFHTSRAWGILLPSKNQHGSLSTHLGWSICHLVFRCWLLSHVIYINLRNEQLFDNLSKFTK